MFRSLLGGFLVLLTACQTQPYGNVEVGEAYPSGRSCREIGQVIGNADTRDGAREQAINDLRRNAGRLSANYVRLVAVTAYGTAARGVAYRCQ